MGRTDWKLYICLTNFELLGEGLVTLPRLISTVASLRIWMITFLLFSFANQKKLFPPYCPSTEMLTKFTVIARRVPSATVRNDLFAKNTSFWSARYKLKNCSRVSESVNCINIQSCLKETVIYHLLTVAHFEAFYKFSSISLKIFSCLILCVKRLEELF